MIKLFRIIIHIFLILEINGYCKPDELNFISLCGLLYS